MSFLLNASYKFSFFISLSIHFFLLFFIFFVSIEHKQYLNLSPIYQVRLVEMPGLTKAGVNKQKTKVRSKKRIVTKKTQVSKAKKSKIGVSQKTRRKKVQTSKVISLKKSKSKSKSKKISEQALVAKKIKAIEKQVKAKERREKIPKEVAKIAQEIREAGAEGVIGGFVNGKFTGRGIGLSFQLYHAQIEERIMNNWILPTFLLKKQLALEAIVIIRIRRDGHVTKIKFEKRSGNPIFDRSVEKAIKNSDPLFPLPKDYTQPYYEVGFRFKWPKGRTG